MDDKSFWRKSQSEMTLPETLALNALIPVATLGGVIMFGGLAVGWSKLREKIANRKQSKSETE